jgi:hypothetical protein
VCVPCPRHARDDRAPECGVARPGTRRRLANGMHTAHDQGMPPARCRALRDGGHPRASEPTRWSTAVALQRTGQDPSAPAEDRHRAHLGAGQCMGGGDLASGDTRFARRRSARGITPRHSPLEFATSVNKPVIRGHKDR